MIQKSRNIQPYFVKISRIIFLTKDDSTKMDQFFVVAALKALIFLK
jgi:hypothetical protein